MILDKIYKILASHLQPRIKLTERFFMILAELYQNIFSRTQYFAPEDLRQIQQKRLLRLIKRAKKNVPFYSIYLKNANSINDFNSLPPISKEKARMETDRGTMLNPNLEDYRISRYTSGSTGVPFNFFLDKNMLARRLAIYRRMFDWTDKKEGDLVIRMAPREHPGLEREGVHFFCKNPEHLNEKKNAFYELCDGKLIILQSYTSILVRLAQLMEKDAKIINFKALISYAEPLYPETRDYFEKVFKAPIFNYYANEEVTAIAQECEFHNGFHVNAEYVYLEIIGEKNQLLPAGETGDIVITSLDNEVMPFIKYRTGDRGYWIKEKCPCGRTLPKIKIEGRMTNSFLLPDGKTGYFFTMIKPVLGLVSKILRYQVIRNSQNSFLIKVIPLPNFNENDKKFIIDSFFDYLGPTAEIDFEIVDRIESMPGGKELAFINLAPGK